VKGLIVGAIVLAVCAIVVGAASAALVLRFSRTSAEPRDTVVARTAGRPFRGAAGTKPRVFLVDAATAASVRSPRDRRLRLLGTLRVDRKGVGRLRFLVPNMPPGDYTTLVDCPTCGRRLVPTGPFPGPFRIKPVLRDCDSSVYGDLPPGWERDSVRAGPLALVGVASYPPRYFEPRRSDGRYPRVKVLLAVDNGVTLTLSVPPSERAFVGLSYDRDAPSWAAGWLPVAAGDPAVTFEGCPPGDYPHTQFNGSVVVAGPRCARLEVHVRGRAEPHALRVPFGRAC
jgi:hypothetical protein